MALTLLRVGCAWHAHRAGRRSEEIRHDGQNEALLALLSTQVDAQNKNSHITRVVQGRADMSVPTHQSNPTHAMPHHAAQQQQLGASSVRRPGQAHSNDHICLSPTSLPPCLLSLARALSLLSPFLSLSPPRLLCA